MSESGEAILRFDCFGSQAGVYVGGTGRSGRAPEVAAAQAQAQLLAIHSCLSRFEAESELSRLNEDPRETVPASVLMERFAAAVVEAGNLSGGLVDATLVAPLEQAGYRDSLRGRTPPPLREVVAGAPPPRRAAPHLEALWRSVRVDVAAGAVARPPGLRLDSGGIAKGMAADLVAEGLGRHESYAVDCAGDLRIGGSSGAPRAVAVDDPFGDGARLHEFAVTDGAIATSGIGRRAWCGDDGRPAHHLLDPATGSPAYTGIVQATALAPTALEAEVLAKAALLSGPKGADVFLAHGGVLVFDDGSHRVLDAGSEDRLAA